MTRAVLLAAIAALAIGTPLAHGQTVIGDLNNFDTINDTGQICHGFEIEIEGIHSTDITYTFDWNHYGTPKIREDNSDPAHPRVFVRYESTKDANGQWGANGSFTNPAIPSLNPPSGHTCTNTYVNEGCEHFGLGYYGTPTTVKYHWLIDDNAGGLTYIGAPVGVATPKWNYAPPAPGVPAQVVAVIPAPVAPVPGRAWGEPVFVKVIKTTSHRANPVALGDLISDDSDGDGKAEWQNLEPDEVESEWKILQTSPDGDKPKDELEGLPDDMGDGSETVTRRYEFYKYGAALNTFDGETGEAMCSDVNPTTDPDDPLYRHGVGTSVGVTDANGDKYFVDCEAQVVVGEYIGAQMAGFAAAAPLGLVDHLQDGDSGTAYTPRTVVVGGNAPYTITVSNGSLPQGLSIGDYLDPDTGLESHGVLFGTPAAGGDFQFTVEATDADGTSVSQAYALHVAGGAPATFDLSVQKLGAGSGGVAGNGIDCGATCTVAVDSGTAVSLLATPDAGSAFTGWGGDCSGTGACVLTMDAAHSVTATFSVSGIDLRVTSATAPPALASPGSAYVVSDTTTNAGAALASASTTSFYLSADGVRNKGDVRLKGSRAVPSLDSEAASAGATTVTIPTSLTPGTYWQLACADDSGTNAESNEANNCLASPTTVSIQLTDLAATAVNDPPAALAPGSKFTATDTVTNVSASTAAASSTRYYLSLDALKDGGDLLLSGSRNVPSLVAGAQSSGSKTLTVPAGTPVGTYRVLACADGANKVKETNEGNNCVASAGAMLVAQPDLVTTQLIGPPATIRLGQQMTLSDTVTNQGQGPAVASTTRYFLSADALWTVGDAALSGTRSVPALASGASSAGSRSVTVPTSVIQGTYYVLACADDTKKLVETDEGNNCAASTATIQVTP